MNGTVAIYDPGGDRVVVLAGSQLGGSFRNEVWGFALGDTSGWTPASSPRRTPPAPRDNYHAVYDPNRRRMLLFLGVLGSRHQP